MTEVWNISKRGWKVVHRTDILIIFNSHRQGWDDKENEQTIYNFMSIIIYSNITYFFLYANNDKV